MNINWSLVAESVDGIAKFLESPEAQAIAALGGPQAAGIAMLAGKAASLVDHLVQLGEGEASVIAAHDLATIKTAQASIQAQNDALIAKIAGS